MKNVNIVLIISGFFIGLSWEFQAAPGTILMKTSYRLDWSETQSTVYLQTKISSGNVLYDKKDRMKRSETNDDIVEISMSFDVTNIGSYMEYRSTLTIANEYETNKITSYDFIKLKFKFNAPQSGGENSVPLSLYSRYLKKELDILISVKCKRNYYPQNKCSVLCIKTENTEFCDARGNKVCQKGYYLNNKTQKCDYDWCFLAKDGCKNNGKCINNEKRFTCSCTTFYTGLYCDVLRDLCERYTCPNGTHCVMSNEKIICKPTTSNDPQITSSNLSLIKNISPQTLIMMMGFVILLVITIGITIWACQNTKKKSFRSMETSINSGHSYYPGNSISKYSNSCEHGNLQYQRCLCMSKSFDKNKAYCSLRQPSRQPIRPWSRAYSDLMISSNDRRSSLISVTQNDEAFPLPLPIDEESHNMEYYLEL